MSTLKYGPMPGRWAEWSNLDRREPKARCCEKARKRIDGCVCSFQAVCPDHGTKCVGTHD